ncbi:hypothetical protein KM043_015256 [Ampulex compressa]|nr:hypothetical protein KM043_015256 [Ampulex compressa]
MAQGGNHGFDLTSTQVNKPGCLGALLSPPTTMKGYTKKDEEKRKPAEIRPTCRATMQNRGCRGDSYRRLAEIRKFAVKVRVQVCGLEEKLDGRVEGWGQQWYVSRGEKGRKTREDSRRQFCPARLSGRSLGDWPLEKYKRPLCGDPLKIVVRLIARKLIR